MPNSKLDYYDLSWTLNDVAAGIDYPGTRLNAFPRNKPTTSFGVLTFDHVDNAKFDAISAVPEASTLILLLTSVLVLAAVRRNSAT